MKKTLGFLLAAFLCAAGMPDLHGEDLVRIRTIRFIINDTRYDWTETSGIPSGTETSGFPSGTDSGATLPVTLASFTELRPGMRLSEDKLLRKLAELEHRLAASGYFMSQSAMAIPSQAEEGAVLALITVTDGFRWQFGGGNAFAMAGMSNAGGARRSWLAAAGYNLAGLRYTDGLVAGKNFVAGAELFYRNSLGYSELVFNSINADIALGVRLHPDILVGADLGARWQESFMVDLYAPWFPSGTMITVKPGLSAVFDYFAGNDSISLYGSAAIAGSLLHYMESAVSLPDVYSVSGTAFAVFKSSWVSLSIGGNAFWNSGAKDFLETETLAPSQEYAIRAPVALSQVSPDMAALGTAELRSPALTLPLGGVFNFTAYFFLFEDIALCARPYRPAGAVTSVLLDRAVPENDAAYFLNAAGAGIRFGFGYPINVLFSLTYGFNRLGQPALCFTGSGGF